MTDHRADSWYPTAAYFYVLHLDRLALAWEYLRRNPDYRRDWLRRRTRPEVARAWGLRVMEDPDLDARDAIPAWVIDHDTVLQLYPDADPPPDADVFDFWHFPGCKDLVHDGKRLVLIARWPGCCLRFALVPGLADGMAYLYAVRGCATSCGRARTMAAELGTLAAAGESVPTAVARVRPSPAALQELHTLQALDATLAGASLREIAIGLFGAETVVCGWYADGGLRSRVRRLVQRGQSLMRGGYRHLAQIE